MTEVSSRGGTTGRKKPTTRPRPSTNCKTRHQTHPRAGGRRPQRGDRRRSRNRVVGAPTVDLARLGGLSRAVEPHAKGVRARKRAPSGVRRAPTVAAASSEAPAEGPKAAVTKPAGGPGPGPEAGMAAAGASSKARPVGCRGPRPERAARPRPRRAQAHGFSPLEPSAAVRNPLQPSAVLCNLLQPSAAQSCPLQPHGTVCGPLQPSAALCSMLQPIAAFGRPMQFAADICCLPLRPASSLCSPRQDQGQPRPWGSAWRTPTKVQSARRATPAPKAAMGSGAVRAPKAATNEPHPSPGAESCQRAGHTAGACGCLCRWCLSAGTESCQTRWLASGASASG